MNAKLALIVSWIPIVFVACGGSGTTSSDVTFWKDVAPIYNSKCVKCHQQGGIAPFRLDNYADAHANAAQELVQVNAGTMPPYFMDHDGSCGSFHDEATLTAAQKATIAAWVSGAQAEGTPVTLTLPPQPTLDGALDLATPMFSPVAQGGALAEADEYRCFLMDPPAAAGGSFLTGYAVTPGEPSIVHHVIAFVVDPQELGSGGQTNAAIMQALDDDSPDRLGWPCFGAAGDGVNVSGVPVTWAPGQGVVSYPDGMGVPIKTTDKLVVQIHYNLADPASAGKSDSTTIHLRFAPSVNRQLAFALPDRFLDSLNNATPDSLPPGQADTAYTWTQSAAQIGLNGVPSADLVAVMPHMHGRGLREKLELGPAGNLACAAQLETWDFHWQEFYFYKTPPVITPSTQVRVTCDYDTRADTMPVLPGWGTRNEMCLTVLMLALPPS
ncbi:MAG TPA: hypothetical protein VIF57_04125 [Polyangia bacterium]|jgi:hypothetical protein